ncbi:MAG: aminopeptidase P family protein [Lachnospiraceae bacterium]|nr:aminopeptidase P family protein [Lachnospiraceae bacterium]
MVKPGVKACDIFHKAMEVTRASGLPAYRRHHVGHGIGLEVYDKPSFAPSDATELQENMVINLETPYYELGWGGVQLEDTMVVTAEGARLFDKSSRDLIVLDF